MTGALKKVYWKRRKSVEFWMWQGGFERVKTHSTTVAEHRKGLFRMERRMQPPVSSFSSLFYPRTTELSVSAFQNGWEWVEERKGRVSKQILFSCQKGFSLSPSQTSRHGSHEREGGRGSRSKFDRANVKILAGISRLQRWRAKIYSLVR